MNRNDCSKEVEGKKQISWCKERRTGMTAVRKWKERNKSHDVRKDEQE
jgi:hypothetical protein